MCTRSWVLCFIILYGNYSYDFGAINGIRKGNGRTLLLCIAVLPERIMTYEKMKNKSKKTLKSISSVSIFFILKSIGSVTIDHVKFAHIPIERA